MVVVDEVQVSHRTEAGECLVDWMVEGDRHLRHILHLVLIGDESLL